MNQEAWPTPHESSREPLPRVEDLPVAEQGYEQDSVRAAFDSFYRHAAQLDAALRTLEAVDSFHRQAAALRADIRTLRTSGWTQQPWGASPPYGYIGRAPREGVSPAVWRIAGEAAFLIAVAVVLGVAKLTWWQIVAVMAVAWLLVGLVEWAASRDRFAAPRPAAAEPPHPVVEATPAAERTEEEPLGWAAFEEAQEPSDAMTMIGAPGAAEPAPAEELPAVDAHDEPVEAPAAEPEPVVEVAAAEAAAAPEPEVEHEAEPAEVGSEDEPEPEAEAVAGPEAERDAEVEREPEPAEPVAAADPPAAAAGDERRRRWWRRRGAEAAASGEAAVAPPEPPRHVRVLTSEEVAEPAVDPWEAGFDSDAPYDDDEATGERAPLDPDEDTGENAAAVTAEPDDDAPRRRFRRR